MPAIPRRALLAAGIATAATGSASAAAPVHPPLVELRRYRTRPGRRDELIALFEQQFVESQEAQGMAILGTFREPGFADRFTWLRGFADMAARERGLNDFYFGPVWKAHREAANACLDDNDDVLLLREARPGSGFELTASPRPAADAPSPPGRILAHIVRLASVAEEASALMRFEAEVRPARQAVGARTLATFVREKSPNNFPRLPVHEDREVFVWFEAFPSETAYAAAGPDLAAAPALAGPSETLVLAPTARSLLR